MKNFVLIGAAGYIAPAHLRAIKATGNNLVAGMDLNDSVGVMDSFFPEAEFFTNFEEFSAFIDDEKHAGKRIDYLSICSPNHLHVAHAKFALKNGIDVICEKPLVLETRHLQELKSYESSFGARVYSILQLRWHAAILELKKTVEAAPLDKIFDVDLTYITSRGKWYNKSWKGDHNLSGGVVTNIGIHLFDMLHFVFGNAQSIEVHHRDSDTCSGSLIYDRASVKWFLSIDKKHLPSNAVQGEKLTFRSIRIEDKELEFSKGFTDLHTRSYEEILNGNGFGVDDNEPALSIVEQIRNIRVTPTSQNTFLSMKD